MYIYSGLLILCLQIYGGKRWTITTITATTTILGITHRATARIHSRITTEIRVTSSLTVQTIIRVISSSHMVQMIISSHTVHSLITITTIRITISSSILTTISILQRIKAQRIMLLHHLYSVLQVFAVVLLAVQLVLFLVLILKRQTLKITDLQLQVSFFLLLLQ